MKRFLRFQAAFLAAAPTANHRRPGRPENPTQSGRFDPNGPLARVSGAVDQTAAN
jgi:hypothetical protein